MKVSIFQPTYLPWIGFFKAIDWSDKFVFFDDVQYVKRSWQSRNRIKSSDGELLLTVPVVKKSKQRINEVLVDYSQDWTRKHLFAIEINYSKTPYFNDFFPRIKKIIENKPEKLMDLNIEIIKCICDYLNIRLNSCLSSELKTDGLFKNDKIIAVLKETKADEYLYAEGAADYMQPCLSIYEKEGIKLTKLKFEHPFYPQQYGEFIHSMSILDLIFNCGKDESRKILDNINF